MLLTENYKNLKFLAIIPARGGSKRIPGKNIRKFCDLPMISFPIRICQDANFFDEIFVSTDDLEISEISKFYGASVPFLRNKELASDQMPTMPVIADFIKNLRIESETIVFCVYATNPFLEVADLKKARDILCETNLTRNEFDFVSTVTTFPFPIQRSLKRIEKDVFEMAEKKYLWTHSQNLEDRFHGASQFWAGYAEKWMSAESMDSRIKGIVIPRWRVQDIDTEEDWTRAELMYKAIALQ